MTDANINPLEVVHRLSCAIAQAADLQQVYQIILDEVVDILGVERASIMVYDRERDGLRVAAARGMDPDTMRDAFVKVGEGISGKVFESDEPLLIEDIRSVGGPRRAGGDYKTKSLISAPVTCFPMRVGKSPLGVINVTDRKDGSAFTDSDLKLLTTASNQLAAYVHLCHLSDEVRASERLMGELDVARAIQQRLLPSKPLSIESLDVAGKVVAAQKVGGDFYDYFLSHARKPSFVVADVSGHNIMAALIMAAFRSVIRAQRDTDFSPSSLVGKVNKIMFEDLSNTEQFASLAYIQYLQDEKSIRYTNAGHPPPLVLRGANGEFEELTTDDPLIGIDPTDEYHEGALAVSPGDVIVLYTDGITEASNDKGDRFGVDRLKRVIEDNADSESREIVESIHDEAMRFVEPAAIKDDITVLVCKIL